jgi:hypothetical protein
MRVCILAGVLALAQVRWRQKDAAVLQYNAVRGAQAVWCLALFLFVRERDVQPRALCLQEERDELELARRACVHTRRYPTRASVAGGHVITASHERATERERARERERTSEEERERGREGESERGSGLRATQ